jgi:hypothetical protein
MLRRLRLEPLAAAAAAAGGVALASSDDRILQAQIFARHGARTPLSEVDGLPVPPSAYAVKPTPASSTPVVETVNVNVRLHCARARARACAPTLPSLPPSAAAAGGCG